MKCETTIKHSLFLQNNVKLVALSLILTVLFLVPLSVNAQMFSVGEDDPRLNIPQLEVFLAFEPMTVTYEGESTQAPFEFEGPVLRLGYKSPTLDLSLGTGGEVTGLDDVSYFDFGGNISVGFGICKTEHIAVRIPIQIASRFTNITNSNQFIFNGRSNQFRFGSLTAGAGAKFYARPVEDIRLEAGIIPAYGFSFASGGVFGGSLGSLKGGARVYLDRLFNDIGLIFGYKYKVRNYDVDEEFYDYLMKAHSFQLGITF